MIKLGRHVVAAAVTVVLLAGCGASGTSQTASGTPASSATSGFTMPASATPTQCTACLYGHAAQVTFSSQTLDVAPACKSWARTNGEQGQYWVLVASPASAPSPSDLTTVCNLQNEQDNVNAVVDDDGSATYGQAACSGLVSAGWLESSAPGSPTTTPMQPPPAGTGPVVTDPSGNACYKSLVGSNGYCTTP
jgi:hypothetical protein